MKMHYNGKEMCYIQIGTVMTRPDCRKRGLARSLIQRILDSYKDRVEGFYLFGNLSAVGFYQHIGFKRLDQYRWYLDNNMKRNPNKSGFTKAGESKKQHYRYVLKNAEINAQFDHRNRRSLQLFYTLNMENVYYNDELDCFMVMQICDGVLHMDSVVSTKSIAIQDVLERVDGDYYKVIFGFTPIDTMGLSAEQFDGNDDYRFFYIGDQLKRISEECLYLPTMSHA
jgi:hypothetical protein